MALIRPVDVLAHILLHSFLFGLFPATSFAKTETLRCGVALGFPPYQYDGEKQKPLGLDVEILQTIVEGSPYRLSFIVDDWINLMASLRFGIIDCICGMEMTEERSRYFHFSRPLYQRNSVVITLASQKHINEFKDLVGKRIGRDLHSAVEKEFKKLDLIGSLRLLRVSSKEEGILALKSGKIDALNLPLEVAHYLAAKHEIPIKVIHENPPNAPVALAVRQGRQELLRNLEKLIAEKWSTIDGIIKTYQQH
ncbi:MAG: substrate-binding periplasmic protein [Oligoflexus sp.]